MEVNRLATWVSEPVEMLAWCARNIFEISLVVHYTLLANQNMDRWSAQKHRDEIELLRGIAALKIGAVEVGFLNEDIQFSQDILDEDYNG